MKYWVQVLLGMLCSYVTGMYAQLRKKQKEEKETREREDRALRNGLIAIMHDRLFQSCSYYLDLGYIPLNRYEEIMDNVKLVYNTYHELGGNGTGTDLYNRFLQLPIKSENH